MATIRSYVDGKVLVDYDGPNGDATEADAVVEAVRCRDSLEYAAMSKLDLSGRHLCWGKFRSIEGIAANFSGADLARASFNGAILCAADFRGADLRWTTFDGADLTDAQFDAPVVQIQGSKHRITAIGRDQVKIGCKRRSLDHWLANYRFEGVAAGYTCAQIDEYGRHLAYVKECMERTERSRW